MCPFSYVIVVAFVSECENPHLQCVTSILSLSRITIFGDISTALTHSAAP
jgi:hypothetical protein